MLQWPLHFTGPTPLTHHPRKRATSFRGGKEGKRGTMGKTLFEVGGQPRQAADAAQRPILARQPGDHKKGSAERGGTAGSKLAHFGPHKKKQREAMRACRFEGEKRVGAHQCVRKLSARLGLKGRRRTGPGGRQKCVGARPLAAPNSPPTQGQGIPFGAFQWLCWQGGLFFPHNKNRLLIAQLVAGRAGCKPWPGDFYQLEKK